MNVAGIDPSLTHTAVCSGDGREWRMECFSSKNRGDDVVGRIRRFEGIVFDIDAHLAQVKPDLILIEGYSFGSKYSRELLGEYGGLIRWHCVDRTPNVFEVAPHCLKKFATGKGSGKKELVAAQIALRWKVDFKSSDEYDAYALYRMALIVAGLDVASNESQREAVQKVVGTRQIVPAAAGF